MTRYKNRQDAGQHLATYLEQYAHQKNTLVLGLPRGGVPVAYEVAKHLHVPLDILLVRKLGVPSQPELAMGAIATGSALELNKDIIAALNIDHATIARVREQEEKILAERTRRYRGDHPFPSLRDQSVILIDDGIATGATMRVAIKAVSAQAPKAIIIATPVMSREVAATLSNLVHEIICPLTPDEFYAVGNWYEDFSQTSDEEVRFLLGKTWH